MKAAQSFAVFHKTLAEGFRVVVRTDLTALGNRFGHTAFHPLDQSILIDLQLDDGINLSPLPDSIWLKA